MAPTPLGSVIMAGESILRAKRYILSFAFLWFWDYALTFKDEVNYAWKGKKSWAFALFLLNRYLPLPYLLWVFLASYWPGYSQKACDKTAFIEILFFGFTTIFAQTTLTLRVYAVTGKNKLLAVLLACISLAQFFFGCYQWAMISEKGFLNGRAYPLFFPTSSAMHWPPIHSDSFRLCFFKEIRVQEVTVVSLSLVYDLLAFVIVIWASRRPGGLGRSKIPTILDRIVRDATMYFLVIFTSHLVVECFILFAPPTYHLLPANSNSIFIPIMATRLMLSLKKAADEAGSFTCTDDLEVTTSVAFAGGHTTMEYAMEAGVSRRDRDQTGDLELVENRPRP
ncbi:hypothetical protein BDM02DRAFT_3128379 [Thelephora ganbajun]|uniref:Uncharacterized protein n=1 Tax=Thelephora ganbajun TaxID=370292 RepID=A0ACB6ZIB7_THEGA|nr:hypothetical protein BDM02DRAFT_3128379 [Thelephora ganbajun]